MNFVHYANKYDKKGLQSLPCLCIMRPSPLQGGGFGNYRRSGSSVWLERSPVTAEVAGSSPVRFVLHEKRHSDWSAFFRVTSRRDSHTRHLIKWPWFTMLHGCGWKAQCAFQPPVRQTPLPDSPLAPARGRGADAGSFQPARAETNAMHPRSPRPPSWCVFFCYFASELSPTTSSSDHGSPCCTDEAGKPLGKYKVQSTKCEVRGARCEVRGTRCEVRGARCKVKVSCASGAGELTKCPLFLF